MLNALFIAKDTYKFRELESALLTSFFVDYTDKLESGLEQVSKLEFSYDVFFLLRDPFYDEIPAVNRLIKNKVFIYQTINPDNWILNDKDKYPVYDRKSNLNDDRKIVLNASNMMGKPEYFKGVKEIAVFNPFHVDLNWEIVLNGNETTMAMIGDIALRYGREVVIAQKSRNFVLFSCDVLSDEVVAAKRDNIKFILNLLNSLLGGAEFVK